MKSSIYNTPLNSEIDLEVRTYMAEISMNSIVSIFENQTLFIGSMHVTMSMGALLNSNCDACKSYIALFSVQKKHFTLLFEL